MCRGHRPDDGTHLRFQSLREGAAQEACQEVAPRQELSAYKHPLANYLQSIISKPAKPACRRSCCTDCTRRVSGSTNWPNSTVSTCGVCGTC